MKHLSRTAVAAFTLALIAGPGTAAAGGMGLAGKTVILVDVPVAVPLVPPQRGWFGMGAMPSLSAMVAVQDRLLLGLRLRGGFLSEGTEHSDPTLHYPKTGGLGALLLTVRVRPFASSQRPLGSGLWLDVGGGPGVTGHLVRATVDAGLGWGLAIAQVTLGPSIRYVQVVETSNALDRTDAKILLVGLEVALRDRRAAASPPPVAPPPPPPAEERPAIGDRDGDGIADDVDRCPNEPETLNGFQDDDGCPDEAPIVVKEDRIYLKELLLFDTNRARVKTAGRPALAAVLELWRQHPEWDHLVIDGHADRHGPDRFNLWLSQVRAERVRNKLVELGFPADRLMLRAFGKSQLHSPATTEEADRANRRVEFVIVRKSQAPAEVVGRSADSSLEPPRTLSHMEVKP